MLLTDTEYVEIACGLRCVITVNIIHRNLLISIKTFYPTRTSILRKLLHVGKISLSKMHTFENYIKFLTIINH